MWEVGQTNVEGMLEGLGETANLQMLIGVRNQDPTLGVLEVDPLKDQQFPGKSPGWKIVRQAEEEREAKMANEGRARSPQLHAVFPLDELVMDKKGRGQTGEDGRAPVVLCSDFENVFPSGAGSVPGRVLASAEGPYYGQKGVYLKPDLNSKCEFWVFTKERFKADLHFPRA